MITFLKVSSVNNFKQELNILVAAVSWVTTEAEVILPCSRLTVVDTGLSQLYEIQNKADFSIALTIGLGQQLKDEYKKSFIEQVNY